MKKSILHYTSFILLFVSYLVLPSCGTIDVFEKNATIPKQVWKRSYNPEIAFNIAPTDTTARFNIYIVIRHTDANRYKNIWLNINTQSHAGVVQNHRLVGQRAMEQLAIMTDSYQRGVPEAQSVTYIPGYWQDGVTAPKKARVGVAALETL